jgi:hypothetical protein
MTQVTNIQNVAENWMQQIVARFPECSGKQMDAACGHIYFEDKLEKSKRFEVLTIVSMKIQVFWDAAPCQLVNSY